MKKIIQWIKESNHYKYIICVGIVAIIAYIMQLFNCPIEIIVIGAIAVSLEYKHIICIGVVAIIAYIMQLLNYPIEIIVGGVIAVSLEYKDYAHGGKFDWQDIIASMIGAIIVLTIRLILQYVIC